MSTTGQFSSKNPTIKRILKEAAELANNPSSDYHAAPLENDLLEWHFTLRGPPAPSPFEGGIYHGRIVLPPAYPLKPPSFRFLTPTGRFEVNREICLSISGHHEETWQPAWGIRTALVAIRSFMDTDSKGQLGGMDANEDVRKRLATQSRNWKCSVCGKANETFVTEQEEAVKAHGGEAKKEEVPEELRLAYREDLSKTDSDTKGAPSVEADGHSRGSQPGVESSNDRTDEQQTTRISSQAQPPASPGVARVAQHENRRAQDNEGIPAWIDKAIFGVVAALIFLVCKKLAG